MNFALAVQEPDRFPKVNITYFNLHFYISEMPTIPRVISIEVFP